HPPTHPDPPGPSHLPPQTAPHPPTAAPATTAAQNPPRPKRHVRQARQDARVRQSTQGARSYRKRAWSSPEDFMADELNVRQLTGWSARSYDGVHDRKDYDYDRRASSPNDYGAAEELSARQLPGRWSGARHAIPTPLVCPAPAIHDTLSCAAPLLPRILSETARHTLRHCDPAHGGGLGRSRRF